MSFGRQNIQRISDRIRFIKNIPDERVTVYPVIRTFKDVVTTDYEGKWWQERGDSREKFSFDFHYRTTKPQLGGD